MVITQSCKISAAFHLGTTTWKKIRIPCYIKLGHIKEKKEFDSSINVSVRVKARDFSHLKKKQTKKNNVENTWFLCFFPPVSALEKLQHDASKATCYHIEGIVKMFATCI